MFIKNLTVLKSTLFVHNRFTKEYGVENQITLKYRIIKARDAEHWLVEITVLLKTETFAKLCMYLIF